ncbi:MAG TPA: DUF3883 domain-containing protein, partial [Anaerolineae bacterium]
VLSVVSSQNKTPLKIEVKTSNSQWSVASFHISQNEWIVAENSDDYLFHLWALLPKQRLYIVHPLQIANHVPHNRGEGTWGSFELTFSAVCKETDFTNS